MTYQNSKSFLPTRLQESRERECACWVKEKRGREDSDPNGIGLYQLINEKIYKKVSFADFFFHERQSNPGYHPVYLLCHEIEKNWNENRSF